jgi:hypothetical protein
VLSSHKISKHLFITKVLGYTNCSKDFRRILNDPLPWSRYTKHRQQQWLTIHEWCQSRAEIASLVATNETVDRPGKFALNFKNVTSVPDDFELDTAKVARAVLDLAEAGKITFAALRSQVLSIDESSLRQMLRQPVPWSECTDYKKKIYYRMSQLSQSSDERSSR